MAALTPPRPLTCRRSAWDGPGANMPGWSRRLRSSAALPWPGSSSGCPRSPGGISGRRGESTERPGGSRRPPLRRPAAGGRSGPPSLLTEGARRTGDLSPFARRGFPRSRPRWLAARAALTAPLRIPGTSGRCRRSPSGSLAPAGAYAEGLWCSAVQAHGCRASGCKFTRRLSPVAVYFRATGQYAGDVARPGQSGRYLAWMATEAAILGGLVLGDPVKRGAAVRLEAAHEPGAEAPARTGPHVPPLRSGQLRNAEARPAEGAVGRPGRARGRN